MKILIAPNSFKSSLNSIDVTHYISCGLRKASKKLKLIELPLADGGTGTSRIITKALDGKLVTCKVSGPVSEKITANYGIAPRQRVAIIEMAEAAGLTLITKKKRNPLRTTTIGVGEMIMDAINNRYRKIILGIGDSATIDCGVGALSVLGVRFLNKKGGSIDLNCQGLLDLDRIDTSFITDRVKYTKITIASDVQNILTGENGALAYARQKGAKPSSLPLIDKALKKFKRVIYKQYDVNLDRIPGSGAAGGIGGAFVAILKSPIISGFGLVKELTYLEDALKSCDIIITGEGRIDKQSFSGKTLGRILLLAKRYSKPLILVCGHIKVDLGILKNYEVQTKYSLVKSAKSLDKAFTQAPRLLERMGMKIGKVLLE